MEVSTVLLYVLAGVAGTIVVTACVFLVWRAVGIYLIRRAGPRRLTASRHVLWRDPGDVASRDLTGGPGGPDGVPRPPFTFIEEHGSGSQPCVSVTDARGRRWRVKWGDEVRSENLAVRLAWAIGYFAEVTYYVAEGRIEGAKELQRTRECIADDGANVVWCTATNGPA